MNDVLELPFDQYQRYRLVADLCDRLRSKGTPLSILDVGGRTALLRSFAPEDEITLVDVEPSDEAGLVLGSGSALPFADASFDVVCAFDTLEHVPPAGRAAFVAECERVARGWIVLAGPYDAPRVAEAEELLQSFLVDKLHTHHRYLEEHRTYGLPDRAATEAQLAELGCRVTTFGHGNLDRWFVLMCLALYLDDDPALRGLAKRVQRFYNASLYASDHAEPVYRHVVVGAKAKKELPQVADLLDPPVAPAGTLGGFAELTTALVAFDQERSAWRREKAEWATIEKDLGADLRGHREKAGQLAAELAKVESELTRLRADLGREQADGRAAIAALERDLAEHQSSLSGVRAELENHRGLVATLQAELERERTDAARDRAVLATDLAEHKASLAELERTRRASHEVIGVLEADLAGHRDELSDQRRRVQDLTGELQHVARELERERTAGAAVREALTTELEALRAHAGELTAMLERERAAQAETRAALEQDLAGHAELVRDQARGLAAAAARSAEELAQATRLNAELVQSNELATRLNAELVASTAELAAERAEIERLRAELTNRWRNVRRALSVRRPALD